MVDGGDGDDRRLGFCLSFFDALLQSQLSLPLLLSLCGGGARDVLLSFQCDDGGHQCCGHGHFDSKANSFPF